MYHYKTQVNVFLATKNELDSRFATYQKRTTVNIELGLVDYV